ncbi:MAG TPA: carbohydrate ABC transporter permease [Anaerolineales bacterium]|nr:carbohydrate ABC transporter permease [Anaerolineales bacterium]
MGSANRGIMSNTEWRSPLGRLIGLLYLIILALAAILVIFPFLFSFTAGLQNSIDVVKPGLHLWPAKPLWANYLDVWQRFKLGRLFLNTAIAAGGGVLAQMVVSSLAAYSLSRLNPIGKNVIRAIILITMAVPGLVYLVPRYVVIAKMGLVDNFMGLWLPYAASSFMILVLNNAFDQIPKDLYEAAQIDGASDMRMFLSITVPLSSSVLLVLGLFAFIGFWGDFLWPFLVLRDSSLQTISVRLHTLARGFGLNLFMAASFIAMIPPSLAAFFLQRHAPKGGLTF